jgi:hypothetical protein
MTTPAKIPASTSRRGLLSVLAVGLGCLGIAVTSLQAVHPSIGSVIRFSVYIFAFNLLPGLVVTPLLLPALRGSLFLIFGLATGIAVNLLALTLLWFAGWTQGLWLLPLASLAMLASGTLRIRLRDVFGQRIGGGGIRWLAGTFFLCLTALLGMAHVLSGDPGDAFSYHFAFQAVIVRGLEQGWPPPNLLIPGLPWSYNYGAHLWVMGASRIAGLPVDILVARYTPVFLGAVAAAAMLGFGRRTLGLPWWLAVLAVMCPFWVVGLPPISAGVFGTFMPYGATLLMSPFLAIAVFFLELLVLLEGRPERGAWRFLILAALTFLATGARGVCAPILLCAVALRLFFAWRRSRAGAWQEFADLCAVAAGFASGLWLFFTIGSGFSGTGFIKVNGQPFDFLNDPHQYLLVVPHILTQLGLPKLVAGIAAFILIAVFQAGFLTPGLPMQIIAMRRRLQAPEILLLGSAIAGIAGVFMTEAAGYSHFSFLYFANVSLPLLGARGLHRLIGKGGWAMGHRFSLFACFGSVVLLALLQLAQLPWSTATWLAEHWLPGAIQLAAGQSAPTTEIATCRHDADADLFAQASRYGPDQIVMFLPRSPSGTFYCETFWLVARSPSQTISDYALTIPPGKADPAFDRILHLRQQHMNAALQRASGGVLSVPDVLSMAGTLPPGRPLLVLAEGSLVPYPRSALERIAANDRFTLWLVAKSGEGAGSSLAGPALRETIHRR